MVYKTFENELKYKIEQGQSGDIPVIPTTPLPTEADTTAVTLNFGWVIIQWNMRWQSSWVGPDWISLELFKPKGPYSNPTIPLPEIPFPPNNGDEIVRADDIGGTLPTKEDSHLWQDYINVYWEYIAPFYRLDTDFPDNYYKVDNIRWACRKDPLNTWPGPSSDGADITRGRTVQHMRCHIGDAVMTPIPIPFRVAENIDAPLDVAVTRKLLVLLLIKRKGRLRLKAWPFVLKIHRKSVRCFIATAAYGSPLAPQVTFLRCVRDKNLRKSKLGSLSVDRFEWIYYKFSPHVAKIMCQYPLFKRIMRRFIVTPIIYFLMSIFKPSDKVKNKISSI